jgi:thiol:disulfide interchange protein
MRPLACAALVLMLEGAMQAQAVRPGPPAADSLVSAAVKTARSEHKVVLIEFGASWCTWCKSFEAFVQAPEVKEIVAGNYVLANLVVHERDDKKALENSGGEALMNGWGGTKSGLPYYVFLDAAGRKIADSNAMPGGTNIGFPGTAEELRMFVGLIDKTAPHLSRAGRATIVAYLNKVVKE